MSEDRYKLFSVNNNPSSDFDVIFIHGLTGDKFSTWENSNGASWQRWLADDYLHEASVWTIAYGANATNWIEDDMSLDQAADFMLGELASHGIGEKPYMFIVHSLGGLLVKKILLKANTHPEYQELTDMCKSIVFFAVPHTGSGWSDLLSYAKPLLRNSKLLKVLNKGTEYLNDLVRDFNGLVVKKSIETYVFYETKEVRASGILSWGHLKKGIIIVSEESATHVHSNNQMVGLPDDHSSICKIDSKDSSTYRSRIKTIINKMIEVTNNMKKDTKESEKIERESKESSRFNIKGDYINGDKYVHDKSVTVSGSNSGTIITGDNNIIK